MRFLLTLPPGLIGRSHGQPHFNSSNPHDAQVTVFLLSTGPIRAASCLSARTSASGSFMRSTSRGIQAKRSEAYISLCALPTISRLNLLTSRVSWCRISPAPYAPQSAKSRTLGDSGDHTWLQVLPIPIELVNQTGVSHVTKRPRLACKTVQRVCKSTCIVGFDAPSDQV